MPGSQLEVLHLTVPGVPDAPAATPHSLAHPVAIARAQTPGVCIVEYSVTEFRKTVWGYRILPIKRTTILSFGACLRSRLGISVTNPGAALDCARGA